MDVGQKDGIRVEAYFDQRGAPGHHSSWDPLVRVFHWSLVGSIVYEKIAEAGTDAHEIFGSIALGLSAVRIV